MPCGCRTSAPVTALPVSRSQSIWRVVWVAVATSFVGPLILTILIAGLTLGASRGAQAAWRLVWSDEFNGNSVNTNHWGFDVGNGGNGWGNRELEFYTSRPENVFVRHGLLHIVARREFYHDFNYTSARLKTRGRFCQKYGRFEFRARLPQGKGYWPAFWLMPEHEVYGGWAASGEIDVMENKGDNPRNVLGTIHYGGPSPRNTHSHGPSYNFPPGDSVANFHIYAVEWTKRAIRWFVDDHLYETQTAWWSASTPKLRNPYPAPFNQPFFIIMNLAVGGNFDGNPTDATIFPGEIQVDYVRVYEDAGHSTHGKAGHIRTARTAQCTVPAI
jgi:beta-glucanase (GH16 family)